MKINVPTVHNEAKRGDIANTVIMPGDPLRAKFIAENFLKDVYCYNRVRNMLGFTGTYKGVKISVQGSGMGIPSMAIYSKELFDGYGVNNIIRIGSAGCLVNSKASNIANSIKLKDVLVAQNLDTDSNYLISNGIANNEVIKCSAELLNLLKKLDKEKNVGVKYGKIFTSDVFYKESYQLIELSQSDVMGVEMETLALYANAKLSNKNAIAMYTVSDNAITGEGISSEEREKGLDKMIKLALDLAYECEKEED